MIAENIDILITNARLATMVRGDGEADKSIGIIENAALAIDGGKIIWIGSNNDITEKNLSSAKKIIDVDNAWLTPGLIDCHSHVVHGGNRAGEFSMRLEGASYEEIARAGGGIISTVTATRSASEDELIAQALPRVDALMDSGVTTLEIKSGYGLNCDVECRMLRAARRIASERNIDIKTTFLGAHALPVEYKGNSDGYIDLICNEMLPKAHEEGLVDAVDAFCEGIAFSTDQVRRVFNCARDLGLPVKLHAEQLSDLKGSILAAEFDAISIDHLEYVGQDGVEAMVKSGSVAVILPGAFYYLNETRKPPIEAFRNAAVPMAVATDANPGSSPVYSLLNAMNMACVLFSMTPAETLIGVTRIASQALGLDDRGILAVGKRADLACWSIDDPAELSYAIGSNPLMWAMVAGVMR